MREFIRDFNRRKKEIEKYFELVDKIENLGISSKEIIIVFPDAEYRIDNELQRILKSHCYLLLYNLIESSIRNGITAIHDAIQIEELTYQQLSTKIKKLWLLNDKSKSFVDSYIKKETVADNLKAIIETVLTDKKIDLASSNIPISGNLDAETIAKLIDMYGFHGNLGIQRK